MRYCVYISVAADNKIRIAEMDPQSGRLQFREKVRLSGSPGPLAVDPTRSFLYAGLRSSYGVATLGIDRASGSLTLLGMISAASVWIKRRVS